MSTTTCAPWALAAAGDDGGGRRALGALGGALRRRRPTGTFSASSASGRLGPDDVRRPRLVLATTLTTVLATLASVPVLVVTVAVFLVVGAVAGLAAASLWAWRTVSPAAAARPGASGDDEAQAAPEATDAAAAPAPRRRLVRDRTLGYDA